MISGALAVISFEFEQDKLHSQMTEVTHDITDHEPAEEPLAEHISF